MAATCGRLEAAIVVPSGGWTVAVNDGVAYNATLTASTVYSGPTALAAAWKVALDAAAVAAGSVKTFTVSIASGEQGTGKTTIAISSGTFSLNWTTTTLRDALGWTGNLAAAGSYTSPSGCLGMWLPDCTISQPFGLADFGDYEADISQTVSPGGVVKTIKTVSRLKHPGITWSHVTVARARQSAEASGVRSFERFVRDCMIGATGLAYFLPGAKITYWPDASTAGTSQQYHSLTEASVSSYMQPAVAGGYVGLWACKWPGGWAV